MPSIEENRDTWNVPSGWIADGDEWSDPWGGTEPEWWGALLPRIHLWVPAATILELGPGHGRWTQYLKDLADEVILVDVAEECLAACRRRFPQAANIAYHVGDGRSLPMVADASVDFAFSFDSLVHAEADVMEAYARELTRTLKPDGVAFLHHSNLGEYRRAVAFTRRVPSRLRPRLVGRGLAVNLSTGRGESVTAARFKHACEAAGLVCVSQELIAWGPGRHLTDALSVVTPAGSRWERPGVTVRNPDFKRDARAIAHVAPLYSGSTWASRRSG